MTNFTCLTVTALRETTREHNQNKGVGRVGPCSVLAVQGKTKQAQSRDLPTSSQLSLGPCALALFVTRVFSLAPVQPTLHLALQPLQPLHARSTHPSDTRPLPGPAPGWQNSQLLQGNNNNTNNLSFNSCSTFPSLCITLLGIHSPTFLRSPSKSSAPLEPTAAAVGCHDVKHSILRPSSNLRNAARHINPALGISNLTPTRRLQQHHFI